MKPKIKEKWIKMLQSGEYKQGKGALRGFDTKGDLKGYCCLGVLCDVHRKTVKKKGCKWIKDSYLGNTGYLPKSVMKWAGISNDRGYLSKDVIYKKSLYDALSFLNDSGMSFKQIAKVIEKQF